MKNKQHRELLNQHHPSTIIDKLAPYVTDRRKQRIEAVLDGRLQRIQLALESPTDMHNAMAAVRTCEALGVGTIHIISPEGEATGARTISQGAMFWVDIIIHNDLAAFLAFISEQNLQLGGAVMEEGLALHQVAIEQPLCLMLGNEQRGLSAAAKTACDFLYHIPMHGMSESLNLSVSAAISLYDTTSRKRQALQQNGDLSTAEKIQWRANYYLNSVNARLIDGLLSSS